MTLQMGSSISANTPYWNLSQACRKPSQSSCPMGSTSRSAFHRQTATSLNAWTFIPRLVRASLIGTRLAGLIGFTISLDSHRLLAILSTLAMSIAQRHSSRSFLKRPTMRSNPHIKTEIRFVGHGFQLDIWDYTLATTDGALYTALNAMTLPTMGLRYATERSNPLRQ